jgi:hypothetical protein
MVIESYTHTRRLAEYLKMSTMGQSEIKQRAEKVVPRELAYINQDGKVQNARELLVSEGLNNLANVLIPTEVYGTIIEGAEPYRCMRNVLPIFEMGAEILKVPYGETGTYAPVVSEGSEIPIQDQTYSVATFTAKKYGVRPLITNEMVADAKFGVIAAEIRKAGWRIENALNQAALNAILLNSGSSTTNASTTPLPVLGQGIGAVANQGFHPTDIIFNPACYGAVLGAFTSVFTSTADKIVQTGQIGSLLGCNVSILGVQYTGGTYNWGWGTTGNVGGIILDRNSAAGIGMREDIQVEQYADPIRDLVGLKATARFDAETFLNAAAVRFIY